MPHSTLIFVKFCARANNTRKPMKMFPKTGGVIDKNRKICYTWIWTKSCAVALQLIARWNPSKLGWNLRRAASDEIKSASSIPTKSDFIAKRFHPTQVGFLPPSADLVEKSTHCLGRQMCAFFWWRQLESNQWPHACQACTLTSWAMPP